MGIKPRNRNLQALQIDTLTAWVGVGTANSASSHQLVPLIHCDESELLNAESYHLCFQAIPFFLFLFLPCVGSFLDLSRKGRHGAIAVKSLVMRKLAMNTCRTAKQCRSWFIQSRWPLGTKGRLEMGRGDRGQECVFEAQCVVAYA